MWKQAPTTREVASSEFLGTGISDVTHITAQKEYFEEAMTLVDEGVFSLKGALSYVRSSVRHHYNPNSFPEVSLVQFSQVA